MLSQVIGNRETPLTLESLSALRAAFAGGVLMDIGTGDGRFVLRAAAEAPTRLALGLDSAPHQAADSAKKARRKPAKGGVPNALFLRFAAEDLPGPFAGWASAITVNYPWGSLLRGVSDPAAQPWMLPALRDLAPSEGARLSVLLNLQPFQDPVVREAQGLPDLLAPGGIEALAEAYRAEGVRDMSMDRLSGDPDAATSWGRRLVRGSGRETLVLEGLIGPLQR